MNTPFIPISTELSADLYRMNPWWRGLPQVPLPPLRRWAFHLTMQRLISGMTKATVLRGPRQVGKSTLMRQIIKNLLDQGIDSKHIFYVQFDELPNISELAEPILRLADWFERSVLHKTFNQVAEKGGQVYLLLDEVQNIDNWAPQLKSLVDASAVRVMLTGSSALRIEQGRDSLAGRITTLEMGPLLLREIAEMRGLGALRGYLESNGVAPLKEKEFWVGLRQFGIDNMATRNAAFAAFSQRGGYPVAHEFAEQPWEELADLLNETIIQRVIRHDLPHYKNAFPRDRNLLEAVFRLACRYVGQAPQPSSYANELKPILGEDISWPAIWSHLKLLDESLLIRLVEPLEIRLKRISGTSKICLCDHALRASWLQEVVPLDPGALQEKPHLSDVAGRITESTAGYFLRSITNLDVSYFPARSHEPEVDYVLTVGEQRIPLEVKYRNRLDRDDLKGLKAFIKKRVYNAPFGIIVTRGDQAGIEDSEVVCLPLSTLLLLR